MTEKKANKIATEIKKLLVEMAVDDRLPMDMTQLNEDLNYDTKRRNKKNTSISTTASEKPNKQNKPKTYKRSSRRTTRKRNAANRKAYIRGRYCKNLITNDSRKRKQ